MTNKGTQDKYFTVFLIFVGMRASVMYNSGQTNVTEIINILLLHLVIFSTDHIMSH